MRDAFDGLRDAPLPAHAGGIYITYATIRENNGSAQIKGL